MHTMDPFPLEDAARMLTSIGERVRLLVDEWPPERGGDIDCAVEGIDHLWPLRAPPGWRLTQRRNYDMNSWFWVLDRDGSLIRFDTVEDPHGIGRYRFPTKLATSDDGLLAPASVRAAYFTVKRLRKSSRSADEWSLIRTLAAEDPTRYAATVRSLFGRRRGERICHAILAGDIPIDERERALRALFLRRFSDPLAAVTAVAKGTRRWAGRLLRPTGMVVVLVGPDGTGKSTLVEELPRECDRLFLRFAHHHWRPGILPPLGRVARTEPGDPTKPHARAAHSKPVSIGVVFYYWLDFMIGARLRWRRVATRTGLVIVERGWWDIAVDPRRYRLDVPQGLLRTLGMMLPKPDLTVILDAPAEVLGTRKAELPTEELERQRLRWRSVLPRKHVRSIVDVTAGRDVVLGSVREAIVDLLEERALRRLGPGWISLPRAERARWTLPRGPRAAGAAGLDLYQPMTTRGRIGWKLARVTANAGAFGLIRRGAPPPRAVRDALRSHIPPRGTLAVARTNHPGRFVALIVGPDGTTHAVAKVVTPDGDRTRLANEARALANLGDHLPAPLRAPRVLHVDEGVLLLEAVRGRPRARPWLLPPEVAAALGSFAASTELRYAAHGDCAPWNLIDTGSGWVLVDWEEARAGAPPFFDVFHHLVQSSILLGRPTRRQLLGALRDGSGWIGEATGAYAEAAGLADANFIDAFSEYLDWSAAMFDAATDEGARALAARAELQAELGLRRPSTP